MPFHGLPFDREHIVPKINGPSPFSIYIFDLGAYVAGGDTIRFAGHQNGPSILGRILKVLPSAPPKECHNIHPHLAEFGLRDNSAAILIQWHLPNDELSRDSGRWPFVNDEIRRACLNLPEVAPTNCTLWISSTQVTDIVFFLHSQQCVEQAYGSVAGCTNTYFLWQEVVFVAGGDDLFVEEAIQGEKYNAFGGIFETTIAIERYLFTIFHESVKSQRLLNKSGKMGGAASIKEAMSAESWRYLVRVFSQLDENMTVKTRNKLSKRCILRSNLSQQSIWLPTKMLEIRADDRENFSACRQFFSASYGTGRRRAFPSKSNMGTSANPADLATGDTINMVDIDLFEEEASHDWFDSEAHRVDHYVSQANRNYVKWVYDSRTAECSTVIKCSALIAGACDAEPLVNLLNANAINWGDDDGELLYVGASVFMDNIVYTVEGIDDDGDVRLVDEATDNTL
eukprot:CAMPEP_0172328240 /NCGR_PEP_ID=MMETSP1058-20130122/60247_1 /TAXON_ID=83371 /ORGANISM="Detonula confervacea, Strain CCMP 353" /LENGTH=454 /DNA_ID=CAMNT_0013045345 /DNA_START=1355 /DNA_END=2715 /DNA_ORIENTATION=-